MPGIVIQLKRAHQGRLEIVIVMLRAEFWISIRATSNRFELRYSRPPETHLLTDCPIAWITTLPSIWRRCVECHLRHVRREYIGRRLLGCRPSCITVRDCE